MNPGNNHALPTSSRPPAPQKRGKIQIRRIADNRTRQVTFLKRKNGLLKKAMELGVLCDSEVAVIVYNPHNGKLFEYSSIPMERVLNRYATYSGPIERRKPEQFFDVAAARAHSNIPVNEPNVAMAAQNASLAASRRPRPTYKFEEELDLPEAKRRKLSSGETPTFCRATSGVQIPHIVNQPISTPVQHIASAANVTHSMSSPNPIQTVPLAQIVQVSHPLPVVHPQYQPQEYGPGLIPPLQSTHNGYRTVSSTQPMYHATPTISTLQCSSGRDQSPNYVQSHPTDNQVHQAARIPSQADAYASIPSVPDYPPMSHHNHQRQFHEPSTETIAPPAMSIHMSQQSAHRETQIQTDGQQQSVADGKEVYYEVPNHSAEQKSSINENKEEIESTPIEVPAPKTDKLDAPHTEAQTEHLQTAQKDSFSIAPHEPTALKASEDPLERSRLWNKENEGTENLPLPRIEVRREDALPQTTAGALHITPRANPPSIPNISEALGSIPRLHIPPTPQGQSTWPMLNSLSSNDGGNSVSLTRFFGLDSSSARRRNRNPFSIPQNEIVPLTPRFFGLDTSASTRSLFQSSSDTPFVRGNSDRENKEGDDRVNEEEGNGAQQDKEEQ